MSDQKFEQMVTRGPITEVSIPVERSGYTGQYDSFERFQRRARVTTNDAGIVGIELCPPTGEMIRFSLEDLQEAVDRLRPTP